MDPTTATPPYSAIADALNKFHTASEPIQALALICVTAMVLGVTWSVCGVLQAVVMRGRAEAKGRVVYGVVEGEGKGIVLGAQKISIDGVSKSDHFNILRSNDKLLITTWRDR